MGDDWEKGSIQMDLTQPVHIGSGDFETYRQLQYFSGYGESLRSYNRKSTAWRAGIAFVR
ncbi:MAG TPA: phospholipase A [Opitutaceae bacterium]